MMAMMTGWLSARSTSIRSAAMAKQNAGGSSSIMCWWRSATRSARRRKTSAAWPAVVGREPWRGAGPKVSLGGGGGWVEFAES